MKVGQLTEYNMRDIFVKKSDAKCGGQFIPWLKIGHIPGSIA